jgi:hypothetical protein
MALDFRNVVVTFNTTAGAAQRENGTADFASTVRRANAAIKGFDIFFANVDRHFHRQEIDIDNVTVDGNSVNFSVDFALRDRSGTFDDPFGGSVEVLVIADVA